VADEAIRPSEEPCVWIHPTDNRYKLSIGFAKANGLIAVTMRHYSGRIIKTPMLFASVTVAFTSLYEGLCHLEVKFERRERRWRSIRMSCMFMLVAVPVL
jgi:hypothetical protein